THTQSFDGVAFHENKNDAAEMRNLISADVDKKVDAYLAGEKKRVAVATLICSNVE
ncbi:hypothetical protein AB1F87_003924, partial [Vibrio mimicus]